MQVQYRWCPRCRRQFPQTEWVNSSPLCLECRQRRHIRWRSKSQNRAAQAEIGKQRAAEARAFVESLKAAPCVDCGGTFPPVAMHFDHRDPSQKTQIISKFILASRERLLAEIEKCDLVCACCHAVRTARQFSDGVFRDRGAGRPRKWDYENEALLPPPRFKPLMPPMQQLTIFDYES